MILEDTGYSFRFINRKKPPQMVLIENATWKETWRRADGVMDRITDPQKREKIASTVFQ